MTAAEVHHTMGLVVVCGYSQGSWGFVGVHWATGTTGIIKGVTKVRAGAGWRDLVMLATPLAIRFMSCASSSTTSSMFWILACLGQPTQPNPSHPKPKQNKSGNAKGAMHKEHEEREQTRMRRARREGRANCRSVQIGNVWSQHGTRPYDTRGKPTEEGHKSGTRKRHWARNRHRHQHQHRRQFGARPIAGQGRGQELTRLASTTPTRSVVFAASFIVLKNFCVSSRRPAATERDGARHLTTNARAGVGGMQRLVAAGHIIQAAEWVQWRWSTEALPPPTVDRGR